MPNNLERVFQCVTCLGLVRSGKELYSSHWNLAMRSTNVIKTIRKYDVEVKQPDVKENGLIFK